MGRREFKALKGFARDVGFDDTQATLRANRGIHRTYGIDLLAVIDHAVLPAPHQDAEMIVGELGMRLGGLNARATNLLLTRHGFQSCHHDPKGNIYYEPTDLGRPHSRMKDVDTKNRGSSKQYLAWLTTVIEPLKAAMAKDEDEPATDHPA